MEHKEPLSVVDALKYFVDELCIQKKEAYALELADVFGHILSFTSRKLQENHEASSKEGETGSVNRIDFNGWVLEAMGQIAKHLFNINEQIVKDGKNVSADTETRATDHNQQ